jgi:hypothetical protein
MPSPEASLTGDDVDRSSAVLHLTSSTSPMGNCFSPSSTKQDLDRESNSNAMRASHHAAEPNESNTFFVVRKGTKLYLNGAEFRFASFNAPE